MPRGQFLYAFFYVVFGAVHALWSAFPKWVVVYYAVALFLLGSTELAKRLPALRKIEPGLVFLGASTARMFLFLASILPVLLNRNDLGLSKSVTLGLLLPFFFTLFWEGMSTFKSLKDK